MAATICYKTLLVLCTSAMDWIGKPSVSSSVNRFFFLSFLSVIEVEHLIGCKLFHPNRHKHPITPNKMEEKNRLHLLQNWNLYGFNCKNWLQCWGATVFRKCFIYFAVNVGVMPTIEADRLWLSVVEYGPSILRNPFELSFDVQFFVFAFFFSISSKQLLFDSMAILQTQKHLRLNHF